MFRLSQSNPKRLRHLAVAALIFAAVTLASGPLDGAGSAYVPVGSFTSGTVFDGLSTPLAGIHVDIEQGGFGTCTDGNGFWSIEGLTPGTYDMVAGRPFCDPHPYAEQVIAGVVAGTSGNDFFLVSPNRLYLPLILKN